MAEIQWVIEIRCVNTLLAEFKVGERGQHICASVPNRDLDPHEFSKLIEGAEAASRIAAEHLHQSDRSAVYTSLLPLDVNLGVVSEVEVRKDHYQIQILKTGEIVSVNMPGSIFGPSELDQFIKEMKVILGRLAPLD